MSSHGGSRTNSARESSPQPYCGSGVHYELLQTGHLGTSWVGMRHVGSRDKVEKADWSKQSASASVVIYPCFQIFFLF